METSPVRSIEQLRKAVEAGVDDRSHRLFKFLILRWLGLSTLAKAVEDDLPFKLDGLVYINPKTGRALTKAEWKVIDKQLDAMLGWVYGDAQDLITRKAFALGKLLGSMQPEELLVAPLTNKLPDIEDRYLANSLAFAEQNAANYVTGVSELLRKDIKSAIVEAQKNKWGSRKLEEVLFDRFGTHNRDFRMIAATELNSNANAAYLLTQLEHNGGKPLLVKGMSNENACPYCKKQIHNHIFAVLSEAPADGVDSATVEGKTYTATFPGKNNVGRSKQNWWACIPAHPHCACFYVALPKTAPGKLASEKLKERMEGYKKTPLAARAIQKVQL